MHKKKFASAKCKHKRSKKKKKQIKEKQIRTYDIFAFILFYFCRNTQQRWMEKKYMLSRFTKQRGCILHFCQLFLKCIYAIRVPLQMLIVSFSVRKKEKNEEI